MGLLFLATGDTIAHLRGAVASGAGLLAALAVPAHDVSVEDVLAEPSWDTSPGTMLGIARRVAEASVAGVVVTHGLDTLEQTALLTELIARPRCPVVFTGAVQGFDVPGSDGPPNLTAAFAAARSGRAGVWVCRDGVATRPWAGDFPLVAGEPESDVALIKVYPGMPPSLLHTVVDAGARGVVLEATGSGNVPVELFTTINELTGWGVPVVIAAPQGVARSTTGATALALSIGAISGRSLRPELARVALMYALGAGDLDGVRKWFAAI